MSFLRSLPLVLALVAGLVTQASAATFNIAFFDTNGASAGSGTLSGTFTSAPTPYAQVTAFSATVNGVTYSSLDTVYGLNLLRDFPNPGDLALDGFAFRTGETSAVNTGVLQLGNFGLLGAGGTTLVTFWALSPCRAACGGGDTLGSYTVTRVPDPEPPVVPLPASAALLPIGLGALALIRRRRARAA